MDPIERFDPEAMGGQLLEAEHLARYHWAGALVKGKRVLDAGCGTGYGSDLLAKAGAAEVVGVDIDPRAFEAAPTRGNPVRLVAADVRALAAELGDFDVVVCFEVIEHLDDPETALDRLAAVLRPDGVLAVSSPNRDVYPPGNPYHKHEFRPEELAETLAARFAHVRLLRQQDWLAAGLFEDDDFVRVEALAVPVAKAVPGEPGKELYSVALAGRSPLPPTPPFVMLTQTADLKWWQELVQGLREHLEAKDRHARELEEWVEHLNADLKATRAGYAELEAVISSIEATRMWRLGTRYWSLRDRLLGRTKRQS
jgi:SAM-dependent methyltransferase